MIHLLIYGSAFLFTSCLIWGFAKLKYQISKMKTVKQTGLEDIRSRHQLGINPDIDFLFREIEQLRGYLEILEKKQPLYEQGRADERASILSWLRGPLSDRESRGIAQLIEEKDHLEGHDEKKPPER